MGHYLKTKTDWIEFHTHIKINDLQNYLNVLVKNLEEASEKVSNQVGMEIQHINDEQERAQYEDWAHEEYWDYKETYFDLPFRRHAGQPHAVKKAKNRFDDFFI